MSKKGKILIKAVYSWFNVYIDNHLILTHLDVNEVLDVMKVLHEQNKPYDLKI